MTKFFLFEEESFLSSYCVAWLFDEDLDELLFHIDQADMLKPRANYERICFTIEARERCETKLIDVTLWITHDSFDRVPILYK